MALDIVSIEIKFMGWSIYKLRTGTPIAGTRCELPSSLQPTIIHRDLRSSNLLIDKNWIVKVIEAVGGFMDHRLEIPKSVDLWWASMIESSKFNISRTDEKAERTIEALRPSISNSPFHHRRKWHQIRQYHIQVDAKPSRYLRETGTAETSRPLSSVPVLENTVLPRTERLNFRQVRLMKENKEVSASKIAKLATPLKKGKKMKVPREGDAEAVSSMTPRVDLGVPLSDIVSNIDDVAAPIVLGAVTSIKGGSSVGLTVTDEGIRVPSSAIEGDIGLGPSVDKGKAKVFMAESRLCFPDRLVTVEDSAIHDPEVVRAMITYMSLPKDQESLQ
ncbi:hypothetical protein LguiB_009212 [Lonicera macranthoides]